MKKILVFVFLLFIASCASSNSGVILPMGNNIFEITGYGKSDKEALLIASETAKNKCSNFVVKDKKIKYRGMLDEEVMRLLNKSFKIKNAIASILGEEFLGEKDNISADDDYAAVLKIECP